MRRFLPFTVSFVMITVGASSSADPVVHSKKQSVMQQPQKQFHANGASQALPSGTDPVRILFQFNKGIQGASSANGALNAASKGNSNLAATAGRMKGSAGAPASGAGTDLGAKSE